MKRILPSLSFLIFLTLQLHAQEYIYPNKLLSDRGLIEYRRYTLEEAKAYENGNSFYQWAITDWGPERRLTDQTDIYTARAILASNIILCSYAVIFGRYAYFIRSTDTGDSWEAYTSLGDSLPRIDYFFPELAMNNSNLILGSSIWNFSRMAYNLGYFKSSNLGATWGSMQTVLPYYRSNQSNYGSLTSSGQRLYFAYNEYDHDSLYVVTSTDWGNTWNGQGVNVVYLNGTPQNMCLRASGNYLHLVWVNEVGTVNVRYSRSTDRGLTWSPEIDIAQDSLGAQRCQVAVQDSHVVVSWMGYKNGSYGFTGNFFIRRSFDNGATWDSAMALTDLHYVAATSVFVKDSIVVAGWGDSRFSRMNDEVMVRISTDYGIGWTTEERISNGKNNSTTPAIAATGQTVHLLWGDRRPEAPGLYYRSNNLLTDAIHEEPFLPKKQATLFAYPNPFNSSVKISFANANNKTDMITIYNIMGEMIKTIKTKGKEGNIIWDARDNEGNPISSGFYFAKMSTSGNDNCVKLLLIK